MLCIPSVAHAQADPPGQKCVARSHRLLFNMRNMISGKRAAFRQAGYFEAYALEFEGTMQSQSQSGEDLSQQSGGGDA